MKIEIYKDKSGQYRWRLIAGNGQIMADSSESYVKRGNAIRAIYRLLSGLQNYVIVG